jgi:transposase
MPNFVAYINRWSAAMPQPNDLSRSLVALDQDSTIIAVVEMSQSSWLVGGILPILAARPIASLCWRGESRANQSLKWVFQGPGNYSPIPRRLWMMSEA